MLYNTVFVVFALTHIFPFLCHDQKSRGRQKKLPRLKRLSPPSHGRSSSCCATFSLSSISKLQHNPVWDILSLEISAMVTKLNTHAKNNNSFCACVLPVCLSTATKTWCSPTTWPFASARACWGGWMLMTLLLGSHRSMILSKPWSSNMTSSTPANQNCRALSMRSTWLWSRSTGEGLSLI